MTRTWRAIVTGLATTALTVATSHAAMGQDTAPPDRWKVNLTPYGWFAGFNGTLAGPHTPNVDVNRSYGNLVDNVDFGISAALEARKGKWGGILDGSYIEMTNIATSIGQAGYDGSVDAHTGFVNAVVSRQVGMEFISPVDVFAGVRVFDVQQDLTVTGTGQPDLSESVAGTWVDPIVGVRYRPEFNQRWYGRFIGDIGGFTAASDITWQLYGAVGYHFSEVFSLSLGYRYLMDDYRGQGMIYNVKQQGALFGVGFTF